MRKFFALVLALVFFPCFALAQTAVTSFYPVWIMTLNLTRGLEDHLAVRNLAAPTVGCLHDYQLQTSDMKALSDADIFLVNGAGMEAFLPEITQAFPIFGLLKHQTELNCWRMAVLLKSLRRKKPAK